ERGTAAALQSLRRACRNPGRATYEMVAAFRSKGNPRKELLRKWIASGECVTKCTISIIKESRHDEPTP
ncbi:unnamed protein product, partial [Effrenium voratum]